MKIGIASDHRGYKLKKEILEQYKNLNIIDCGTDSEESVDYPDYAFKIGECIKDKKIDYGIVICGSGIGISIACNKVKKVRCAKVNSKEEAYYTRNDNDSNVIALSGKIDIKDAIEIINTFINTPFSNEEKHIKRINKISEYEERNDR